MIICFSYLTLVMNVKPDLQNHANFHPEGIICANLR